MDYSICLNNLSYPAEDSATAYNLLNDAFQGLLYLNSGNDRFLLYYDGESLSECLFAEKYSFEDYKETLCSNNEIDLLYFVSEVEDKAPFVDHLTDEEFQELSISQVYFNGIPYERADIFGYAYLKHGIMMSLSTTELWCKFVIPFNIIKNGSHIPIRCNVYNISAIENSEEILKETELKLTDVVKNVRFSETFNEWYESLQKEDRNKVKQVILHCCENEFNIGRPVIDTIRESDYGNMKEIRVGNAHADSGKIRILFASDHKRIINLLVGFIKHSNDYSVPIKTADDIFKRVLSSD